MEFGHINTRENALCSGQWRCIGIHNYSI